MSHPKIIPVVLAVLFVATFADNASAVRFGPVDLHPYLNTSVTYDDNVYVRNVNKKEDVYFLISPGLLVQRSKGDNLLELEYRADLYRYIDTAGDNNVNDHNLRGAAHLNTDGRLWMKLDDLARDGHEPRSEAVAVAAALNRYYSNDVTAEAGYELTKKLGLSLAYENYYVDYYNEDEVNNPVDYRDRSDNGVALTAKYQVMPKTKVLVQGTFKDIYHTDNNPADTLAPQLNSREYWAMTGVTWDITDKSTGVIKGGYEWKNFKSDAVNDFSTPVFLVSLNHRFTPKTSVTVEGSRQAYETDDPETDFYTSTKGAVKLGWKPAGKIEVSPFFSFSNNRYAGDTAVTPTLSVRRLENVYTYGLDVAYNMNKWIAFTLGYNHNQKVSTIKTFDYTQNTVSFMVSATL